MYKFPVAVIEKILAIFSSKKRSNSAGLALTCSKERTYILLSKKSPLKLK